jgi:hypothetical protein
MVPIGITEESHNLASVVDVIGLGVTATGGIEGGKAPPTEQKSMGPSVIIEFSHDLASIVDAVSPGFSAAGVIEGGKAP